MSTIATPAVPAIRYTPSERLALMCIGAHPHVTPAEICEITCTRTARQIDIALRMLTMVGRIVVSEYGVTNKLNRYTLAA